MAEVTTELDYKEVFGDWYYIMKERLFAEDDIYMSRLIDYMDKEYKFYNMSPPNKRDVFRAFQTTSYKKLKVVIVGQDPYPDGKGTGLAFGNNLKLGETKLSPSLHVMQQCIEKTIYKGLNLNFDPSLISWAQQGVLLLNSALTCRQGEVGSHSKYWRLFTKRTLQSLNESNVGICYLFLGAEAGVFAKNIDDKKNFVFRYHHPAFSARNGQEWNCPYFNIINDRIEAQNGKEFRIKW